MYNEDKVNPFGEDEGTDLDEALFGSVDVPDSGRVIARPTPLDEIMPDVRQPRRAIPLRIRGDWNGNPGRIRDLLMKWLINAQAATGAQIADMTALLIGDDDLPEEYEGFGGVVGAWVELIGLAQRIYAEGLQNPITIYTEGGQKVILTGERRYLAHWLLRLYVDKDAWSKIPARVVAYSVRQQISENTARRDLNAVGLARCYAMIVMELYREEGKDFKTYDEMVYRGDCDRPYYAQVSDMQVPYGKSGEVMSALNVKTRMSISQYKSALSLPDQLWIEADNEDWSLRRILDYFESQKPVRENVKRDLHSDEPVQTPPPTPPRPQGGGRPDFGRQALPERPVDHGGGVREWGAVDPVGSPSPSTVHTPLEGEAPDVSDGNNRLLREMKTWRQTEGLMDALSTLGTLVDDSEIGFQLNRVKSMTPSDLAQFEDLDELHEFLNTVQALMESVTEAHWHMYYAYVEMLVAEKVAIDDAGDKA